LAVAGIAACDLASAGLAFLPLEMLWLAVVAKNDHDPDFTPWEAVLFLGPLLGLALIPCLVANLALGRRARIRARWLAPAAMLVVVAPAALTISFPDLGNEVFHWLYTLRS
jgi:hypothetical protein